jgi:hypothetical protein
LNQSQIQPLDLQHVDHQNILDPNVDPQNSVLSKLQQKQFQQIISQQEIEKQNQLSQESSESPAIITQNLQEQHQQQGYSLIETQLNSPKSYIQPNDDDFFKFCDSETLNNSMSEKNKLSPNFNNYSLRNIRSMDRDINEQYKMSFFIGDDSENESNVSSYKSHSSSQSVNTVSEHRKRRIIKLSAKVEDLKEEIALLSEKHKMMKEVIYFRNMTMTI